MKTKQLKKDEMRLICLDGDAVFELLTETMIDGAGDYFDLLDVTKVNFSMRWCPEQNCFVCAVVDENDWHRNLDLDKAAREIGPTTQTMFAPRRYRTVNTADYEIEPTEDDDPTNL